MTMFGLSENEIAPLLAALAGREIDRETQEQIFARAFWTGIAEPGDRMAGVLVSALGAPESLRLVVAEPAPQLLLDRLREAGADIVTAEEATKALERWAPRVTSDAAVLALRQAARVDARLLVPGDELWPTGLDDLEQHAPPALWVRGTDAALAALSRSCWHWALLLMAQSALGIRPRGSSELHPLTDVSRVA